MEKYLSQTLILFALMGSMMLTQALAPENMLPRSYAQDSQEAEEGEESEEEVKSDDENTILPITALNFSVIKKGRVRGTVSIVPVLVIKNPTDDELHELRELLPLIRSDLMSIANLLSQKRFRINKPIDPDLVARHFQNRLDKRIGAGRIKVYIQDAIIRPVR